MQALESLLEKREKATKPLDFDSLNHCIHCYAHIINICSSHIIASVTSTSKSYLSDLKVPVDPNNVTCDNNNNDDKLDDSYDYDDFDPDHGIDPAHWPSPLTIEGTLDLSDGFQALNTTLSNVLEDLSISYTLRINARRGFAKLSKMETSLSGSSGRTIKASAS